jgi:hypothetical protein
MALRRLVLAAVCIAAASMAIASTASARTLAQARDICPDGAMCLFEHANWDGKYVAARYGISHLSDFGFNDRASSYVNDATRTFCLYEHDTGQFQHGGAHLRVTRGGYTWYTGAAWNDRISSIQRSFWPGDRC